MVANSAASYPATGLPHRPAPRAAPCSYTAIAGVQSEVDSLTLVRLAGHEIRYRRAINDYRRDAERRILQIQRQQRRLRITVERYSQRLLEVKFARVRPRDKDGPARRPRDRDGAVRRPRHGDGAVRRPRYRDGAVTGPRDRDGAVESGQRGGGWQGASQHGLKPVVAAGRHGDGQPDGVLTTLKLTATYQALVSIQNSSRWRHSDGSRDRGQAGDMTGSGGGGGGDKSDSGKQATEVTTARRGDTYDGDSMTSDSDARLLKYRDATAGTPTRSRLHRTPRTR